MLGLGILGLRPNWAMMPREEKLCVEPPTISPQRSFKVTFIISLDQNGHSFEVDIWSLGVITYAFVCGRPPFETTDVKTTYSKIKNCNYSFPDNVTLSPTTKRFISKMLMKDPSRRATIDEILNDGFFTEMPFPRALPISLAACPPNSAFIKQYSEVARTSLNESNGISTSRDRL